MLETAHEDAERDDEHLVDVKGNTAKLTRLVKALNEHSRAWREVMNKEGDAREAVGMLCQSDLRRRLERHLVKQGGSTATGLGRVGSGGFYCVTTRPAGTEGFTVEL